MSNESEDDDWGFASPPTTLLPTGPDEISIFHRTVDEAASKLFRNANWKNELWKKDESSTKKFASLDDILHIPQSLLGRAKPWEETQCHQIFLEIMTEMKKSRKK